MSTTLIIHLMSGEEIALNNIDAHTDTIDQIKEKISHTQLDPGSISIRLFTMGREEMIDGQRTLASYLSGGGSTIHLHMFIVGPAMLPSQILSREAGDKLIEWIQQKKRRTEVVVGTTLIMRGSEVSLSLFSLFSLSLSLSLLMFCSDPNVLYL